MCKQVLVIRKDLMNPFEDFVGKMVAQGGHGYEGALLKLLFGVTLGDFKPEIKDGQYTLSATIQEGSPQDLWLRGDYKKTCVYVESEEELLHIKEKAEKKGLPCFLVVDNGLTKFDGVKTITALGIGPCSDKDFNRITRHLPLL